MDPTIHIIEELSPEEQKALRDKLEAYRVAVERLSEVSPSAGMMMGSDLLHTDTVADFLRYLIVLCFKVGKECLVAGIKEKLPRTKTLYWEQYIIRGITLNFWPDLKTETLDLFSDLGLQ